MHDLKKAWAYVPIFYNHNMVVKMLLVVPDERCLAALEFTATKSTCFIRSFVLGNNPYLLLLFYNLQSQDKRYPGRLASCDVSGSCTVGHSRS